MNSREVNSSRELTCWQSFGDETGLKTPGQNALLGIFLVLAICNLISSIWYLIAALSTPKLRKPTWIFKSSMAAKDGMFAIAMSGYALWNVLRTTQQSETLEAPHETQSLFNPIEFVCNVIFLTGFSSSFIHILLITFDRHQVIARPFRYHTGELLPANLAYVLAVAGWTFSFVIALTVATQSLESAEREMKITYVGALFPIYRIPGVQKWLLGAGLCLIYSVAAGLFAESFVVEWNRAKKRREQLFSGVGDLEPVRSRNNSVSHSLKRRKNNPCGIEEALTNSEADANDFLLTAGGFGRDLSKKDEANEEAFIFTPVNYRPSLRRRIRDTWSLYSALICFIGFTIMVLIPLFVILLADEPQAMPLENNPRLIVRPYSYCVGVSFTECLLMMQGFAYVVVYVIIDDVFRPHFLRPFQKLQHKQKTQPTQGRIQKEANQNRQNNTNQNA